MHTIISIRLGIEATIILATMSTRYFYSSNRTFNFPFSKNIKFLKKRMRIFLSNHNHSSKRRLLLMFDAIFIVKNFCSKIMLKS